MDTVRPVAQKPIWKKYWYVFLLSAVLLAGYLLTSYLGKASYFVAKDTIVTATVEQGDFRVDVRASGVLKPSTIRWVSSQVAGRVEQVLLKAGARVNQGDIMLRLSNPELHRDLETARWELRAKRAESEAELVALDSQQVDIENSVISAKYNYQSAKLKLDAETELFSQGNGTVSALEYQKSQLAVEQYMQFWQAQQQKAKKMRVNIKATKVAHDARIGLLENSLQRAQTQVEALNVRAPSSGVVQQVSLQLGERTQVGGSVALLADQRQLFAELQVQEVRVGEVALGQGVTIDTRSSLLEGKVIRIDPAVESGMVTVDVELMQPLPAEARPELTVEGLIAIAHIKDALFVKRPVYAPGHTQLGVYKLTHDHTFAQRTLVDMGQSSVNKIRVLNGLSLGDEIIVSDTADWAEHEQIRLN